MLALAAWRDSPTLDEVGHLSAGLSHWRFARFELYAVNPPLVRSIAAIPLAVGGVDMPWRRLDFSPNSRSECYVGEDFVKADARRAVLWLTVARWFCLSFTLLGSYICFRWASELFGCAAGFVALTLWCFSPTVLAYGHLITPDAGAAATGVSAAYGLWRWLETPTWGRAFGAGLLLGLAELTKTTWMALFPLWVAVWIVWRRVERRSSLPPAPLPEGDGSMVSLRRSPKVQRKSDAPRGSANHFDYWSRGLDHQSRLRLRGFVTTIGRISIRKSNSAGARRKRGGPNARGRQPFRGISARIDSDAAADELFGRHRLQKPTLKRKMWSYLNGEWRFGGWWYYYLYALAIKEPLGTWLLVALAVGVTVSDMRKRRPAPPSPLPEGHGSIASAAGFVPQIDETVSSHLAPPPEGDGSMLLPPARCA